MFHRVGGALDGQVEFRTLGGGKSAKHMVDHAAVLAGRSDAYPQTRHRAGSE